MLLTRRMHRPLFAKHATPAPPAISCAIVSAGLATHPDRHIEHTQGYTSIANKRAAQVLESGSATTDYLQDGDKLVIDMKGKDGASIFGAIHQTVFMQPGITA
jgi:fumarylacetoacetate (FAA) hydrolase